MMKRSDVAKEKHSRALAVWTLQRVAAAKDKAGSLRYPQTDYFQVHRTGTCNQMTV